MHQKCGARVSRGRQQGANHSRKSRFTEGTESEAGQRNAELHAGNDAMEVPEEDLNDAGANVAFADELTHAREAHSDQRELRRRKEAIERDERENANEAYGEHC